MSFITLSNPVQTQSILENESSNQKLLFKLPPLDEGMLTLHLQSSPSNFALKILESQPSEAISQSRLAFASNFLFEKIESKESYLHRDEDIENTQVIIKYVSEAIPQQATLEMKHPTTKTGELAQPSSSISTAACTAAQSNAIAPQQFKTMFQRAKANTSSQETQGVRSKMLKVQK